MDAQRPWAQQLDRAVDAQHELMVRVRRHLHAYPEPSGEEFQTTRYVAQYLGEAGLAVRVGPEQRGLVVDGPQPHGAAGPGDATGEAEHGHEDERVHEAALIALRADMDALHIEDTKSVDYRSRTPGVMHACGHDAHTATVLGAALALTSMQRAGTLPWPVRWRAVFQPAEETSHGALEMIEAGALTDVAAILSLHMDPSRAAGDVGVRAGTSTADCDEMVVEIHGRGGHASRPHESLDPIAAAAQLISSIYLFVPRGTDSRQPVVVTIGQIVGGANYNVIPDHVLLRGTVRSLGGESRRRTLEHIQQLARGIGEASGTRIEVRFRAGPPSVYNDPALTDLLRDVAMNLLGTGHVQTIAQPSMGGEDFAHYLAQVPGAMVRVGCAATSAGGPVLHSPDFDVDERALSVGAKLLARAAVSWSNPQAPRAAATASVAARARS